jgi:hypothetical protein
MSDGFWRALVAAGVFREDEFIRRIVIDVQVGEPVVMYVERDGDERLLDVALTLDGVEIRGVDGATESTDDRERLARDVTPHIYKGIREALRREGRGRTEAI